ncbi:MAG: flavin oxidoreductase [Bacteroides sp.]|nr:flavin oxidoreductase [Bacteroides sp.]MDE7440622.1 flavin reductase [Muribaculaceae bacterium]
MKNFKSNAWLLPQPVLIIGTYNEDGTPNAMNAAWGGQWDYHELFISLGSHATTENLKRNPEFTVAFATVDSLPAADFVGIVSAKKDPDKMKKTGWSSEKGETVDAPVFSCFPMTMECRIKEKLYESESGFYMVAEILNIQCDEKYLGADGRPDVEKMHLITFDPINNSYIELGSRVGSAFRDGLQLK